MLQIKRAGENAPALFVKYKIYTSSTANCAFLSAISTRFLATAIIDISESSLLTQEPHPIAEAPEAKAREAVVGLIPVAVITGISILRVNSIVFDNVNSALSRSPLTPFEGASLEKCPSVWIKSIPISSSSLAREICSPISNSPGIVTQKNISSPSRSSIVLFARLRTCDVEKEIPFL